jgi:prepilin-type processing-associated H-X9-DG protein
VTDGTSKTFAIGERDGFGVTDPTKGHYAAYWTGVTSAAWVNPVLANVLNTGAFRLNGTNHYSVGSLHAGGGGNCTFADGSVEWISENIDGTTWELLGQIADGKAVPLF